MRWRSISWTACKGGYRVCLGTINLGLLTLAGLQLVTIASVLMVGEITIPKIVQDYLERRVEREGFQIGWSRALIDLTGKVTFEDIALYDETRENLIFEAEKVRADFDLSPLFWRGPLEIESFFLRDGALYLPPELSDGSDAPLLGIAEIKLVKNWNVVDVQEALLTVHKALILAEGKLALSGYKAPGRKAMEDFDLSRQWRILATKVLPFVDYLDAGGDSTVEIRFESNEASQWSADTAIRIARLHLAQPDVQFHRISARLAFSLVESQFLITAPRLSTEEIQLRIKGRELTLANPSMEIFGDYATFNAGIISPSEFRLIGQLSLPELEHLNLGLSGRFDETFTLLEPLMTLHRDDLRLTLRAEMPDKAGVRPIHFDFSGEPDTVFDMQLLLDGGIGKRTAFSPFTRIEGSLSLLPDNHIGKVNFNLNAKQFYVQEAFFDEVLTKGFFKDNLLQVGPIRVFDDAGQHAEGYFIQDFSDTGFRIIASGEVKPHLLDSLLPPFYTRLWQDIELGDHSARADVDVVGRWNDDTTIEAFVDIEARNTSFRSLPVDRADVLIWYANGFVELIGLEALTDGFGPRGDIAFTFARPGSTHGDRIFLDIETVQPLDTLPVIFGQDMEVLAGLMRFETPPTTQLKGFVNYGPDADIAQRIDLRIVSRSPGSFRRVPFDRIQLSLHQENEFNFIPLLEGQVDDGRISLIGQFSPASNGDGWATDISIDSDNLPVETFKAILKQLDPNPGLPSLDTPSAPVLTGKVDLELDLTFDGVPWESLGGNGHLRIEDANLGRIHLFGGLSRVFSSVGLNITSLQLDRLETTLNLAPGEVAMPNLILRGPALRIDAPGKIALPSTFLDFRAKAYLLDREEPSLQSLLGSILSPLSFFLEVDVKGSFDVPVWRLTKNPFNILRAPLKNPPDAAD